MFFIQIISSILLLFVIALLISFILSEIDGGPAVFGLGIIIVVFSSVLALSAIINLGTAIGICISQKNRRL